MYSFVHLYYQYDRMSRVRSVPVGLCMPNETFALTGCTLTDLTACTGCGICPCQSRI